MVGMDDGKPMVHTIESSVVFMLLFPMVVICNSHAVDKAPSQLSLTNTCFNSILVTWLLGVCV